MASYFPPIGCWYQDHQNGQLFEVVAIDEKNRTVEVQFEDGDIAEYDVESWGLMQITPAEAPDNAYGGYGIPSAENDLPSEAAYGSMASYANPIDSIEPDSFSGFDDLF